MIAFIQWFFRVLFGFGVALLERERLYGNDFDVAACIFFILVGSIGWSRVESGKERG